MLLKGVILVNRLKELRNEKNLKQSDVAKIFNCTQQVGQVRHLRAAAHRRLLDLHVGAGLGTLAQVRAGAQVGPGARRGAVVEHRLDSHRLIHGAARAHHGVGQARVRAYHAVLPNGGGAHEHGVGQHGHVGR